MNLHSIILLNFNERYGEETNGWINKIFWGDNLQVMSHLLKEYRGKSTVDIH